MSEMAERVLGLLPEDGRRMYYGQWASRCRRELHLSAGLLGALLAQLCTQRRAAVEDVNGYDMVRRLPALPDFPLVARPHRPAPRVRRSSEPTFARPRRRAHSEGVR